MGSNEDTVADPTVGQPATGGATVSISASVITKRDEFFERQEHYAAINRLRQILPFAVILWLGFFTVDVVISTWMSPGPLGPYILLRLAGTVPLVFAYVMIRGEPPFKVVKGLDLFMTSSCAAVLTAMAMLSGGLASPYNAYIPMVLVGRSAIFPEHWKEGAVRLGVPALINPLMLAAAGLFSADVAAQWATPSDRGIFFFWTMLYFGAWILLVIAGHNVWALRRQVFRSRSIGRYRLEKRIGEGGMGEVWLAYHDQLKRKVALKILRPDRGTDPVAVGRFEREVMATAALTHPNTIRIYEHGVTDDGLWFYAMELLQGRSLGAVVADEGPLPPRRAVHLLLQTARALGEAHRAGTVHRDIKPDNLFVTDLGGEADFIKVLDFGIAKMQEADRDIELTGPGFVAGTPAYISPEVATGQPADARSDVYGLGGTLYYALTGTLPFLAETAHEMFVKHLREELEPPSKRIDRPVPPDVEAVIMRCMEKQPEDRFADANEVADALADCEVADEPHDIVAERAPTQPRMPALARRTAHYKE